MNMYLGPTQIVQDFGADPAPDFRIFHHC